MHMSTSHTTLPEIAVVGLNEICPEIKSADKQWQRELFYRFCMAVTVIFCLRIVLLNTTALLHRAVKKRLNIYEFGVAIKKFKIY